MAATRDFNKILDHMIGDDPKMRQLLEEAEFYSTVAQLVYDARERARLTQKQLAELVGTKQPAIARLEDADYGVRTLSMLQKIARALHLRLTVKLEPIPRKRRRA